MRRRALALALVVAVAPLGAACGTDADQPAASPDTADGEAGAASGLPAPDPAQVLPPNDVGTLRNLYDPVLEPLGLRLTRGALIDLSSGGYEPSNTGTHLALYAEPLAPEFSNAEYIDTFWKVAALVTPDVFARWSELESYDICLEPVAAVDDDPEPFPVTQVNLTREAADQIDWQADSVVTLLTAAREVADVKVIVSRELRQSPEYQAVLAEARGTDTTDTTSNWGN